MAADSFNATRAPREQLTASLTARQREVLSAAISHGYYDNPRSCSLTELADELGIAKSTCSGILQRLEARVMQNLVGLGR